MLVIRLLCSIRYGTQKKHHQTRKQKKFQNHKQNNSYQLIYWFMQKLTAEALLHLPKHLWRKNGVSRKKMSTQIEQTMIIKSKRIERQTNKGKL